MVEISPYSESKEIVRARQLLKDGKFDEVLSFLKKLEENMVLTALDQLSCHLIISYLYMCYGNYEESQKYSQKAYQESRVLNNHLFSIDALIYMAWSLIWLGDLEKAHELIIQGEEILKNLSNIPTAELKKREGYINAMKGSYSWFKGDINQAEMYATRSLELFEKIGYKNGLVEILLFIGSYNTLSKRNLSYAQKTLERGLTLAEKINHPFSKSNYPAMLGLINASKGEFKKALEFQKRALPIFRENNNEQWYIATLNNMSSIYIELGDFESALLYIKKSLELAKEKGDNWKLSFLIGTMIEVLFNKGDLEQANMYLEQLENIHKIDDNKSIERIYKYSKAIILKESPRIRNRAKAEKLFYQLIKKETVQSGTTIQSYLHLCELLLDEIQSTKELEILEEIYPLINQLLKIANGSNSFWTLSETYILQAKLAVITFDLKGARLLLIKAQKIAEKHGMRRLAVKISTEHDNLLKELDKWKKLEKSKVSLTERINLARLNEQMAHMLKKRILEVPEPSIEEPVLLLFLSEGGVPFFSHTFGEDRSFKSHLFGGFLTTIDYFIREMFSEGLDRAIFGDYILIMKSVPPFFISYIFKGSSYYALQKTDNFINRIQEDNKIWNKILKYSQANQTIQLNYFPSLESLITEIFTTKIHENS